jgi:hypothetical protein
MDGIFDPWAWRSDMNAPDAPRPEAKSFRPRTILDNVPPMVADALSSAGASGPVAADYANRAKGLAQSFPPTGAVDLASSIGNEAHNGNYGRAADMATMTALMGLFGRGLMPGNRDVGMAKMLERFDGPAAISPFHTSAFMKTAPGTISPMQVSRPQREFMGAVRMDQPANVNNRKEFKRIFGILDNAE